MNLETIWQMSRGELLDLLESGDPIPDGVLDDTEYRGVSLGLPRPIEKLTWKKFRKAFHRDPVTGRLRGWNVRLEQNALDEPDRPKQRRGGPHTFGHFEVRDVAGYELPQLGGRPVRVGPGRMLDYGLGGNGRLDPIRALRDPVVALDGGEARYLLGWSYLDLGRRQVGTPSFFTLELAGPLTHVASP